MTDTVTASVKLTDYLMSRIDELVKKGIFVNRSEAIREAVRLMIISQFGILKGKQGKAQITPADRATALKALATSQGLKL